LNPPPHNGGAELTFLFSDIEGSTHLVSHLGPAAWAVCLEDHHRIMRAAIESAGGSQRGTEGDAFFVVFSDTPAALAAALRAQRDLGAHPWPPGAPVLVRMGIHRGEVLRGGDDYVGLAVHEAARICSAAHGGQVLLSAAAASPSALPDGASLRSLGLHRLKDLRAPVELFQLCHPDLRALNNTDLALPTRWVDAKVCEIDATLVRPEIVLQKKRRPSIQ